MTTKPEEARKMGEAILNQFLPMKLETEINVWIHPNVNGKRALVISIALEKGDKDEKAPATQ